MTVTLGCFHKRVGEDDDENEIAGAGNYGVLLDQYASLRFTRGPWSHRIG